MTETSSSAAPVYTTGQMLRFAPVRNLLWANFVLFTGVALQAAAVGKEAFDISGRTADLGWIGLAEFVPAALLVLVTGTVADRFNRRIVAICAVSIELLSSLSLLFYSRSNPTHVWPMFVISFFYGIGRAFQAPALRAMPPMVAPDGGLPKVIALFSATWTGAIILGPAVSGFLYAVAPWVAYLGSSALILAGWGSLWFVRFVRGPQVPGPDQRPTLHSAFEGLRFIKRTPILLAAISLDLFAVLFGGAVALLPAIADERLHVGDVAYGWLRAAPGIGAAAMALVLAARPIRRHVGRTLLIVVGIFGVGTLVLGITQTYLVAFGALVVLSAADMISVFIRGSLVPLVTPDEKRGRVLAVENVFIGASNELGAFESGIAAQALGVPTTVIGGGVGTLIVVGVWVVAFPALRNIDRFEDLEEDSGEPLAPDPVGESGPVEPVPG